MYNRRDKRKEEKEASYWFVSSWWRQQRAPITTGQNEISTSSPWFISPPQVQMLCRLKGVGMIIVHHICIWLWLTVLMALPEVFQVFYVDEVVTGMTYDLCWGQIHILWDPAKKCNKKKTTHLSTKQKQVYLLEPPPGRKLCQRLMKKTWKWVLNTFFF